MPDLSGYPRNVDFYGYACFSISTSCHGTHKTRQNFILWMNYDAMLPYMDVNGIIHLAYQVLISSIARLKIKSTPRKLVWENSMCLKEKF